jgi:YD repeat-containing protein
MTTPGSRRRPVGVQSSTSHAPLRRPPHPRTATTLVLSVTMLAGFLPVVAPTAVLPAARAQVSDPAPGVDLDALQGSIAETRRNADGSFTTELFTSPVQYETPSGDWKPIDSSLVPTTEKGYDFTNAANAMDVLFDATADGALMEVQLPDASVALTLEGASAGTPKVKGTGISYAGVFDGVDLRYDVQAGGVKETIVIADPGAPTTYRFTLVTSGEGTVDAQPRPGGSWEFFVGDPSQVDFILEAPVVEETGADGVAAPPVADVASMDVAQQDGTFLITVALDEKWLQGSDRQFPILLDPSITIPTSAEDAAFKTSCTTDSTDCKGTTPTRLNLGGGSAETWGSALKFDLSAIPAGASITDADLGLFFDGTCIGNTTPCGGNSHQIRAYRMQTPWDPTVRTNQLSYNATQLSSFTLPVDATPQWMTWDLTGTVVSWFSGALDNHGVFLKRSNEALSTSGPRPPGKRYTVEASVLPRLEVTWSGDGVNLLAPLVIHSDGAELRWQRYAGAPSFDSYRVHRSATAGFTPSASTLIATIGDEGTTSFRDTTAAPARAFTYAIVTAGGKSNEQTVALPPDGQTTATIQPGPAAGKTAHIATSTDTPGVACRNYGAGTELRLGTTGTVKWRDLLAFDLRGIPSDATISAASLLLYYEGSVATPGQVNLHRVTRSWVEGSGFFDCNGTGMSWKEAQAGLGWTALGGDFNSTVTASVNPASRSAPGVDSFTNAAFKNLVQGWVNGTHANHGVLLKLASETLLANNNFSYYSDDLTVAPTLRPRLVLTYADDSHANGPAVVISSHGANAKISGTANLTASASDDGRVERVEFYRGTTLIGTDSTEPYAASWNTGSLGNGGYSLTAKAVDDAGNTTTSAAVPVTVNNAAPSTTSLAAPDGTAPITGVQTLIASATPGPTITKVEFYADDILLGEDTSGSPNFDISWNTLDPVNTFFDGPHVLTSKAYDSNGRVTTSAPVSVTLANTVGTMFRASFDLDQAGPGDDHKAVPKASKHDPDSPTATPPRNMPDPPVNSNASRDPGAPTPEPFQIDATVKNESNVPWQGGDLRVWFRWYRPGGDVVYEGPANDSFPQTVQPGHTKIMHLQVIPPALPVGADLAAYRLRIDIYDEATDTWFALKGNRPVDNPVVVDQDLGNALGLEEFFHYTSEPVGAGMTHLVNVANGNSLLRWTPFTSPGRGLTTVASLTYNSREDRSESPVGNNFSLGVSGLTRFGLPLDVHPNHADDIAGNANRWISFTDSDGTVHRFEGKQATDGTIYWEEPKGVHLYLRQFSSTDPLRKWALTRPDRVTFYFDTDGYPTSVEDRNGNRITYTLTSIPPGEDPGGPTKRITSITDAGGRSYAVDYYSTQEAKKPQVRGKVKRITDHEGHALDFEYYLDGNLLRITQRGGQTAEGGFLADRTFVFTYTTSDGSGPAIPLPANRVTPAESTPNQSTRLYSVRDPLGHETLFQYCTATSCADSKNRWKLKSRTNRAGEVTSFAYDIVARRTTQTAPAAPLPRVTKFDYDTTGKVTQITDPANKLTTLQWSFDFHVLRVTEPTGAYTAFTYNANGYPLTIKNLVSDANPSSPVIAETLLTYNNVQVDGNDVSGKWKAGRGIPHISQLTSKTDPNGTETPTAGDFKWVFWYFPNGNLQRITDPEGFFTTFTYNTNGTLLSMTDARGTLTKFYDYDPNGFPARIVEAEGQSEARTTRFGYDADGLLLWVQDPLHAGDSGTDQRAYKTFFDYDDFHRLGRQSTPRSTRFDRGRLIWTSTRFDANDNPVASVAPHHGFGDSGVGPTTTTAYDLMDRKTLVTGPDTSADPAGERTAFAYDGAGRLIKVTLPKGVQTPTVSNDFSTSYDYDVLDRVIREISVNSPAGGGTQTLTTHNCYDDVDNLVSVTAPKAAVASVNCASPPAFTSTFTFDDAHRMLSEADPLGHTRSFVYDLNGNLKEIQNPSPGGIERRFYDERNLLIRTTMPFASRQVTTRMFYDQVGNMTKQVSPRGWDTANPAPPFDDEVPVDFPAFSTSYVYDRLNRLVRTDLPVHVQPDTQYYLHRSYDPNDNLTDTTLATTQTDPTLVPNERRTTMSYFDPGWIRTSNDHVNSRVLFDYTAEGCSAPGCPWTVPATRSSPRRCSGPTTWTASSRTGSTRRASSRPTPTTRTTTSPGPSTSPG